MLRSGHYFDFYWRLKNPTKTGEPDEADDSRRKFLKLAAQHFGAGHNFFSGQFIDLCGGALDDVRKSDTFFKKHFFIACGHLAAEKVRRRKRLPKPIGLAGKIFSGAGGIKSGVQADEYKF